MNQTLCTYLITCIAPYSGLCLQVFHQAGPPQRVDCLAAIGNKRNRLSQRCIASWGIELEVRNFTVINPTFYQLNYRRRLHYDDITTKPHQFTKISSRFETIIAYCARLPKQKFAKLPASSLSPVKRSRPKKGLWSNTG